MSAQASYRGLRAPQSLRRAAPLHIEAAVPPLFAQEARLYADSPEAGLYALQHGHADRHGGCHDRFARHLPWNARSLPRGARDTAAPWHPGTWFATRRRVAGTVAALTHPGQQGWFHWLFDVLPRQALLEDAGEHCDAVYIDQAHPFQRETWARLGVAAPVIDAATHARVQAQRLLVPSAPSTSGVMPPWVCDWLRARLLPAGGDAPVAPLRLYISRQRAARGRVHNAQAVERVLHAHGFVTVEAETLTFAEQLTLFTQAEAVAGPHGAGLANLVFAPAGCRVIELFAPGCMNLCYWTLACQRGLPYAFLLGGDAPGPGGVQRPDIAVDTGRLERLLARVLETCPVAAA